MSRFSVTQKQDRFDAFLVDVESIGDEQFEGIWGWASPLDWDDVEFEVFEIDTPDDFLRGFSIQTLE